MNAENKSISLFKQSNYSKPAIALVETDFRSLTSLLISTVTNASFSHAMVRVDGVWYDSSETRGYFDKVDIKKYNNRWLVIIELDSLHDNANAYLEIMMNVTYNWKGVLTWPFQSIKNGKFQSFYCFQAAWLWVWMSTFNEKYYPEKVDAEDIKTLVIEMVKKYSISYQKGLVDES